MKKTILILTVSIIMSGSLFAYGGNFMNKQCYKGNNQNSMLNCQKLGKQQNCDNQKNLNKKDAENLFNEFVKNNLKGYTIESVNSMERPRRTLYFANLKDASGNKFQLRINRFGRVMGPILIK